ncbi:MAG: cadmium-translocating P-type ATPase [Clostridium sp.]|nr:cadmium-translocating P-type ATPase [Clostridium sp.]
MNKKFNVIGMTCSACSASVEKAVKKLEGINSVNVNLLTNSMIVDYDEEISNESKIIEAVTSAGYGASVFTKNKDAIKVNDTIRVQDEIKEMKKRLIISFIFLIPLMYISMGHMIGLPLPSVLSGLENAISYGMTQFLLALVIVYVNRKYYQVGFKTLFKGSPNMDTLIAIGSSAAMIYGIFAIYRMGYGLGVQDFKLVEKYHMDLYFESAAMILALINLGKYLEKKSKGKTSEAITKLMNLAPKTANVLRNNEEITVSIDDVIKGDIVIVKPGESIPVDGVIIEGSSFIDQSAITGESIPIEKNIGDKVIVATINKNGYFKFKAEKVGDDTTLAQIITLVEDASSSKAPIAKLADKISGIFVPIVILISIISAIIWLIVGQSFEFSLSIGIAVLVISCPCALGLATPVAIMVGTGKGAENGILIKSAEALEIAHTIKTVVLDKTGTITEGKPKVTDIIVSSNINKNELLKIAASIEKPSEHPLSEAIIERAKKENINLLKVDNFISITGKGVRAEINKKVYYAGNLSLMEENNIDCSSVYEVSNSLAEKGKTPLYFSDENNLLGVIAVADTVKSTSKKAIKEFKNMGIDVVMLTGDNKKTAEAIRKELNIDKAIAEVLPQDKEKEVRRIQESGKKVAMIGDGINDAPALARADVGIAIGAGTDIAIESADIVLMKSDLLDGVTTIKLSRAVIKNIKENLFWAFFYNSIGIPLAAGVFYNILGWKLNPMFGAFAMSLSSVCVVLNALRLRFFKAYDKNINEEFEEGEDEEMKKIVRVDGMNCSHCQAKVEGALSSLEGVSEAKVNLKKKIAIVTLEKEVNDDILLKAVNDAGFTGVSVSEKKGLFGR